MSPNAMRLRSALTAKANVDSPQSSARNFASTVHGKPSALSSQGIGSSVGAANGKLAVNAGNAKLVRSSGIAQTPNSGGAALLGGPPVVKMARPGMRTTPTPARAPNLDGSHVRRRF